MSLKVNVNVNRPKVKQLSEATKKAISMTAEQLRTEVIQEQLIPFDTGHLQNVQTYIDRDALSKGQVKIVHDTPYAARLYFNPQFDFSTDTNANARGEWWEPWISGENSKRPSELFRQFYRNITGV